MDTFAHVFILVSIVVGLGLAHVLHGVGRLIQHPGRYRTDWVHLLWVAFAFVYILAFWWFQYGYRSTGDWTFWLYIFVVGYAILLYLMSVVLLPEDLGLYPSFREYFVARRRWFFGLLAVTQIVDAIDTLAKGTAHVEELGVEYWVQVTSFFVLAMIAAISSSRWFHAAFAVMGLGYTFWFLVRITTVQ